MSKQQCFTHFALFLDVNIIFRELIGLTQFAIHVYCGLGYQESNSCINQWNLYPSWSIFSIVWVFLLCIVYRYRYVVIGIFLHDSLWSLMQFILFVTGSSLLFWLEQAAKSWFEKVKNIYHQNVQNKERKESRGLSVWLIFSVFTQIHPMECKCSFMSRAGVWLKVNGWEKQAVHYVPMSK